MLTLSLRASPGCLPVAVPSWQLHLAGDLCETCWSWLQDGLKLEGLVSVPGIEGGIVELWDPSCPISSCSMVSSLILGGVCCRNYGGKWWFKILKILYIWSAEYKSLCVLCWIWTIFSFSAVGVNLFYFCIIIYLYGDLAIYAAAVPVSLMQVTW